MYLGAMWVWEEDVRTSLVNDHLPPPLQIEERGEAVAASQVQAAALQAQLDRQQAELVSEQKRHDETRRAVSQHQVNAKTGV